MTSEQLLELAARELCDSRSPRDVGIAGAVGDAIFACELARHGVRVDGHAWMSRAVQHANSRRTPASLHRGLAGLGMAAALYAADDDFLDAIDRALLERIPDLSALSLQNGIAGVALYACVRSCAATGTQLQRAVLDRLAAEAIAAPAGVLWPTTGAYIRARGLTFAGDRAFEYGVLHGVAGILVALAALARQGHDEAAQLARLGISAVLASQCSASNRFGRIDLGACGRDGSIDLGAERWCVGDAGVAYACWLAAAAIGDPAAEQALTILRETASINMYSPTRPDLRVDLCCGAAALAQVYRRLHWATGEAVFRDAAAHLTCECTDRIASAIPSSFAYGRKGTLLTLLAAAAETPPAWDAVLGLSLPPRAHS